MTPVDLEARTASFVQFLMSHQYVVVVEHNLAAERVLSASLELSRRT